MFRRRGKNVYRAGRPLLTTLYRTFYLSCLLLGIVLTVIDGVQAANPGGARRATLAGQEKGISSQAGVPLRPGVDVSRGGDAGAASVSQRGHRRGAGGGGRGGDPAPGHPRGQCPSDQADRAGDVGLAGAGGGIRGAVGGAGRQRGYVYHAGRARCSDGARQQHRRGQPRRRPGGRYWRDDAVEGGQYPQRRHREPGLASRRGGGGVGCRGGAGGGGGDRRACAGVGRDRLHRDRRDGSAGSDGRFRRHGAARRANAAHCGCPDCAAGAVAVAGVSELHQQPYCGHHSADPSARLG